MPREVGGVTIYDAKEVAEILQINIDTARMYLKTGRLRGTKIGRRWYVTDENIKVFLNAPYEPPPKSKKRSK